MKRASPEDAPPRPQPRNPGHTFRSPLRDPEGAPCTSLSIDAETICIAEVFYTNSGIVVMILGHERDRLFRVAWAGTDPSTNQTSSGVVTMDATELSARCVLENVYQQEVDRLLWLLRTSLGLSIPTQGSRSEQVAAMAQEYLQRHPGAPVCWTAIY